MDRILSRRRDLTGPNYPAGFDTPGYYPADGRHFSPGALLPDGLLCPGMWLPTPLPVRQTGARVRTGRPGCPAHAGEQGAARVVRGCADGCPHSGVFFFPPSSLSPRPPLGVVSGPWAPASPTGWPRQGRAPSSLWAPRPDGRSRGAAPRGGAQWRLSGSTGGGSAFLRESRRLPAVAAASLLRGRVWLRVRAASGRRVATGLRGSRVGSG